MDFYVYSFGLKNKTKNKKYIIQNIEKETADFFLAGSFWVLLMCNEHDISLNLRSLDFDNLLILNYACGNWGVMSE